MRLRDYRVILDSSYQETITFDSGVQLFQDTRLEHQEKTTLTGTVVWAPPAPYEKLNIKAGDKIYFRYDVVGDSDFDENGIRRHANRLDLPGGATNWFVNELQVLATEQEGEIKPVSGIVFAKPVTRPKWTSSFLVAADQFANEEIEHQVTLTTDAADKGLARGDRVLCRNGYIQHYNFHSHYGQDILVIPTKYIVAKLKL